MSVEPISRSGLSVDLSPRFLVSTTVAASPALAAETTIATLTIPSNVAVVTTVILQGYAAFTVGTSGSAVRLRIRQTGTSGTVVADTGAITGGISAANLVTLNNGGQDTGSAAGQVYVLTLQVTAGAAASTVSNVQLLAIAV